MSQLAPEYSYPVIPLVYSLMTPVDLIVEEMNRYAEQTLQGSEEWSTDAEIREYMGFMILIGIRDSGLLVHK